MYINFLRPIDQLNLVLEFNKQFLMWPYQIILTQGKNGLDVHRLLWIKASVGDAGPLPQRKLWVIEYVLYQKVIFDLFFLPNIYLTAINLTMDVGVETSSKPLSIWRKVVYTPSNVIHTQALMESNTNNACLMTSV